MSLKIMQATESDATFLANLLSDATQYKVNHNDMAWGSEPFTAEEVNCYMANGVTYVAYLNNEPVGTFSLQWDDKRMWGEQASDAAYLHRLAIKQNLHGQRLGQQILKAVEQEAIKNDRKLLRLDCAEENEKLGAYYEKQDFTKVGTKEVKSGNRTYVAALYEKRIKD